MARAKVSYTEKDIPVDMAKRVMLVQDACNLSGVVHSFDRDVSALWKLAHENGQGTDWVNQHPIVVLYLDKLCDMAGIVREVPMDTYTFVEHVSKGGTDAESRSSREG